MHPRVLKCSSRRFQKKSKKWSFCQATFKDLGRLFQSTEILPQKGVNAGNKENWRFVLTAEFNMRITPAGSEVSWY